MIGLSLSFCIRDIATGKVPIGDVEKLVVGTKTPDDEAFESVLQQYCEYYWYECAEEAVEIARRLRAEGKIEQPRLENDDRFPNIAEARWVETEEQITWQEEMYAR